jgi:hypothetical protein
MEFFYIYFLNIPDATESKSGDTKDIKELEKFLMFC